MTTIKKSLYRIRALTNLHVGSGDNNYGLVDKLVQRDAINDFPVIHASSLKGALKDYAKELLGGLSSKSQENKSQEKFLNLEQIIAFGDEQHDGKDKFFSAHLLTMPVRGITQPWYNATCPFLLNELISLLKGLGFSVKPLGLLLKSSLVDLKYSDFMYFSNEEGQVMIENCKKGKRLEIPKENNILKTWVGEMDRLVILSDKVFMDFSDNLPIVARNRLDDDKNLWYEEFVPRESVFVFAHYTPQFEDGTYSNVMSRISNNTFETPIQIGANASVDYGYCHINQLIGQV
jgi:CRISPR-associated protein Cmr4